MQYCPQCGSPVENDKKFCTNCGASLVSDLSQPQNQQPAAAGTAISRSALIAAAGAVFLIIIIAIAGYAVISGSLNLPFGGSPDASERETLREESYVEVVTFSPTTIPLPETLPDTAPAVTTEPAATTKTPVPTPTKPIICPADRLKCDNVCVDSRTDNKNCGRCGNACPSGQYCLNGNCAKTCSAGQTSCPDGCFNLQTDPNHCGMCTNNCPAGLLCVEGTCRSPVTPQPVPI
jgi:hypothetical protein